MNSDEPNIGPRLSNEGLFNLIQSHEIEPVPDSPVSKWPEIEQALNDIWNSSILKSDWILVPEWFIRKARKYHIKPNFCKRKFKRRSKRKWLLILSL